MRTALVIDRIRAMCPAFATVDHALTSAADIAYPAALVTPLKAAAAPPGILGVHRQMVDLTFGVYVIVRRRQNDSSDYGAADELDSCLAQLRAAIPAWTPDPVLFAPCGWAGGQIDRYQEAVACWRDDYSTTTELRI